MKYFIILFICFISSLWIVNYEDTSDVLKSYDSIYVFREYTENDENVTNPELDDLELKSNIVIIFYSILFGLLFYVKMHTCDKYVVYNT
jgi:hypothetical protein